MIPLVDYFELYPDDIPYDIFKLLPTVCQYCDHLIVVSEELTSMKCGNYKCPMHMAHRADKMFKLLGIADIGSSTAYDLIMENNLTSHIDILGLSVEQMPKRNSTEVKQKFFNRLQVGRRQQLNVLLDAMQLQGIGDKKSGQITSGYSTFREIFEEFPTARDLMFHLRDSIGLSYATENLRIMTYHLLQHKEDLLRMDTYFNTVKSSKKKIKVVMTDTITSVTSTSFNLRNRLNYIKLLNEKYEGIVTIINNGSTLSNADFLLTDSTKNSAKRRNAIHYGTQIVSFADFAESLEKLFGEGKPEIDLRRVK